MSLDELALLLVEWRKHTDSLWLADAPFGTQRQALKDLDRAFSRQASRLAQSPRFKRRGRSDNLRLADMREFKLDHANSRILLPKLGWVRYRNSRAVVGTTRGVTVSASGGDWFVSLLTERNVARPVAHGPAVGIDMGMVRFATLSDGQFYTPLNSFRRHEKRPGETRIKQVDSRSGLVRIPTTVGIQTSLEWWAIDGGFPSQYQYRLPTWRLGKNPLDAFSQDH